MSMAQAKPDASRSRFYVAMDEGFRNKPKVQRIVSLTGCSRKEVAGNLMEFWEWVQREAIEYELDTGLLPGVDAAALCRVIEVDQQFCAALADPQVDWVRFTDQGIVIPGFDKRFSRAAWRRKKDTESKWERRNAATCAQGTSAYSASVFSEIRDDDLGKYIELVDWFEKAISQPRPICRGDDSRKMLINVLAAGRHAADRPGVKNRIGLFAEIVGKQKWGHLSPQELQHAKFWCDGNLPEEEEPQQHMRRTVGQQKTELAKRFGIKHA
jgi:hypothetical protein